MKREDIPPEDLLLCNDAEGCDNCKWNLVCFEEEASCCVANCQICREEQ